MTIGMIEVWRADPTALDWVVFLGAQLGIGVVVGLGVVTSAIAGISYGAASICGGSGFLAVYLTGVALSHRVVVATAQRSTRAILSRFSPGHAPHGGEWL